ALIALPSYVIILPAKAGYGGYITIAVNYVMLYRTCHGYDQLWDRDQSYVVLCAPYGTSMAMASYVALTVTIPAIQC
ncbi:MAG: hypothetical protein ACREHG_00110, partial [Candidatus Saccharimonadales bacterium]